MSKILAIDTATEACSAALMVGEQVLTRCEVAPRVHAQRILPLVQSLLDEAGLSLGELDALTFGRGPGSFTGVRIGIGVAQGLAFGAELPLLPVSNLAALAQGMHRICGADRVMTAIDARMSEIYWGRYELDAQGLMRSLEEELVVPPQLIHERLPEQGKEWQLAGTGWEAYPELMQTLTGHSLEGEYLRLPEAQDLLPLAVDALARGETVSAAEATPVYLRDKVTWKKLPGRE